ncbi:MAG: amidohydrolase family protein [Elusimicrobia bacterium]|nr:amidohydrolase family protein [Elusimicrobiota bacterium]
MLDLIIRGGTVFDGAGSPRRRADVGVRAGRVVRVAESVTEPAAETVDATGLWVAPGFVDIHTHYDVEVEIAPGLTESTRHGVTSVVMGNCSLSLTVGAPQDLADIFLRVENIPGPLVRRWLSETAGWSGPDEYFEHLAALPLGPNVAALLGHSALRASVMGLERSLREFATPRELERMEDLAATAFEAGALGISVDMVPWHMMSGKFAGRTVPSQHAGFTEYARLAELCRRHDRVFQVTPNPQKPWTIFWILWLAMGAFRSPLRVTILTALDAVHNRWLWRLFPICLFVFNRILGCNIRFQTLTEPFTMRADGPLTPLFEEFPAGVMLNDLAASDARKALWRNPRFRAQFRHEWLHHPFRTFHRDLSLMTVIGAPDPSLVGKHFALLAERRCSDPLDLFMDLLRDYDVDLRWEATGANDRPGPRRALLSHPHILPGFTDAGAHVRNIGYYDGPLTLLKDAVQSGFMTPERAISRCTGEAAAWFRLDAGLLKEGSRANIILLDPARLMDPPAEPLEIEDPLLDGARRMVKRQHPDLVRRVFVNGTLLKPVPTLEAAARLRRSRPDDSPEPSPFAEYWDAFLVKHRDPRNIFLHCVGVALFYTPLAAVLFGSSPWWLALLPLSQLAGLLGHALFERSPIDPFDAVFTLRASWALNKMFVLVLAGRYLAQADRAAARLEKWRASRRAPRRAREAVLA